MKQIFFDQNQSIVIKVFPSSQDVEREICGAKTFARFVQVPKIERLDNKVAKLSLMPGFLGYQISESSLNSLIASFLLKLDTVNDLNQFSILEEIESLVRFFVGDQQMVKELKRIKRIVKDLEFVPVHGDLQKQNILISEGQIGLIDFEHFILAPKELEFCNSLFFSDGNCLNVVDLLKLLPNNYLNMDILRLMLMFYSYKQIKLEQDKTLVKLRLNQALKKLGASYG